MFLALKRSIIFLLVALLIAFVIIPAYEYFAGGVDLTQIIEQIRSNLAFESTRIWKRVSIYFLALWCGKAMLWALSTAPTKPQ